MALCRGLLLFVKDLKFSATGSGTLTGKCVVDICGNSKNLSRMFRELRVLHRLHNASAILLVAGEGTREKDTARPRPFE